MLYDTVIWWLMFLYDFFFFFLRSEITAEQEPMVWSEEEHIFFSLSWIEWQNVGSLGSCLDWTIEGMGKQMSHFFFVVIIFFFLQHYFIILQFPHYISMMEVLFLLYFLVPFDCNVLLYFTCLLDLTEVYSEQLECFWNKCFEFLFPFSRPPTVFFKQHNVV